MSDGDTFTCPFFPEHQMISRHKLPFHIAKCKKNYSGPKMDACPFNACHYFEAAKKEDHFKVRKIF
jgi:hypothetical protein